MTIAATLAAAAEATAGTALGAGIMGLVATGAEIVLWWQVSAWNAALISAGAGPVHTETGLHAALILTIGIAVIYLTLGTRSLRSERTVTSAPAAG